MVLDFEDYDSHLEKGRQGRASTAAQKGYGEFAFNSIGTPFLTKKLVLIEDKMDTLTGVFQNVGHETDLESGDQRCVFFF